MRILIYGALCIIGASLLGLFLGYKKNGSGEYVVPSLQEDTEYASTSPVTVASSPSEPLSELAETNGWHVEFGMSAKFTPTQTFTQPQSVTNANSSLTPVSPSDPEPLWVKEMKKKLEEKK